MHVLPFATVVVSGFMLCICLLKCTSFNKKFFLGLVLVFVFISIFTIIGEKSPRLIFTIYSSIVAFFCFDGLCFSKTEEKFLKCISWLIWSYLVIRSINYYTIYSSNIGYYINSNTMAIALINLSMLIIYFLYHNSNKNIWIFIVTTLTFMALVGYHARGCFLAYSFFIICLIMQNIIFRKRIVIISAALSVLLCGLIIPFAYIYIVSNGYIDHNVVSSKDMFTRVRVWKDVVSFFCEHRSALFYGLPTSMLELKGSALHSNYLELLSFCGLGGFLVYYGFVINYINRILFNNKHNQSINTLIIAFASLMILGYTEVSMFWAVTYVHNYMFLGIASGKNNLSSSSLAYK